MRYPADTGYRTDIRYIPTLYTATGVNKKLQGCFSIPGELVMVTIVACISSEPLRLRYFDERLFTLPTIVIGRFLSLENDRFWLCIKIRGLAGVLLFVSLVASTCGWRLKSISIVQLFTVYLRRFGEQCLFLSYVGINYRYKNHCIVIICHQVHCVFGWLYSSNSDGGVFLPESFGSFIGNALVILTRRCAAV